MCCWNLNVGGACGFPRNGEMTVIAMRLGQILDAIGCARILVQWQRDA
jgi:hypothetical protein